MLSFLESHHLSGSGIGWIDAHLLASKIPDARAAYRSRSSGARFSVAQAATPAVGDIISLNANSKDACTNSQKRPARVMAVSSRAIVVADTTNPTGGFTSADFASFAATFDQYIDPTDRQNFGDASRPCRFGFGSMNLVRQSAPLAWC